MKKFLLLSAFAFFIVNAFSQAVTCPTDAKRNNGNNCNIPGATGGNLTVEFASAQPANLQIRLIVSGALTASVIETTKSIVTKPNGSVQISWCFETDNLGSIATSTYQYQFYLDKNGNGQQDLTTDPITNEPTFLCNQATLPVSLRNFNANLRNSNVSLSWITETENNAKGFAVERRMGNGAYVEIGFVNSKAINGTSSTTLEYNFSDANLKPSTVAQYRLRQVDLDGKATYSEIRSVRNGAKNLLVSVYPNPSRGTTNITIPDGVGMVDISLEDFTGKTIQRYNGINRNNMQLTNMKPGLYVVRVFVRETGESISERISVQ